MNIIDLRPKIDVEHPQEEHELNANPEINPQRRQFLKFLLVGSGAFVLGWLTKSLGLSGLFSKSKEIQISSGPESETQLETELGDWRVEKKGKEMIFYDKKTNEEVFILD